MNANLARWRLDGQTCLITGASKGIGLACAREFAALGADVLMVARDEAHLETARAEVAEEFPEREILAFAADVAEREQRLEVFDWIAERIKGLARSGMAIIVVEHLMGFIEHITDRVIVMNAGKEIFEGTLAVAVKVPEVIEVFLGGEHAA